MAEKEIRHILLLSGGKDSTALALYMHDNYPEIELEYVFTDTHKELEETYDYMTRIEAYLGKEITRLQSSMDERGFDYYLKLYGGYLPSPQMRWCTKNLKIKPFEKYVGDDPAYLYIGIRADEYREGYTSTKPNLIPIYPFKDDGIIKEDVIRILEESGVGMPDYYKWRSRSGCYFCFFQRKSEWVGLYENHPDLFLEAIKYEKEEEGYTWQQGESLSELIHPDRIQEIKEGEVKRKEAALSRRKPKTLAEMFSGEYEDLDDSEGCLICHL
jgi:3'-phosphoadenosine 5'-phosphosulfate sulfotransferase (PAPS reductase)/FAD synthetase